LTRKGSRSRGSGRQRPGRSLPAASAGQARAARGGRVCQQGGPEGRLGISPRNHRPSGHPGGRDKVGGGKNIGREVQQQREQFRGVVTARTARVRRGWRTLARGQRREGARRAVQPGAANGSARDGGEAAGTGGAQRPASNDGSGSGGGPVCDGTSGASEPGRIAGPHERGLGRSRSVGGARDRAQDGSGGARAGDSRGFQQRRGGNDGGAGCSPRDERVDSKQLGPILVDHSAAQEE